MISNKRLLSIVFTLLFTVFASIGSIPAQAAVKKSIVPEVQFANAPVTEYTAGDRVQFNISSPNYGGLVEYRVVLWDDSQKSYKDLWNETNGYPNRYYTKWQPTGNTIFTLGWPISEPGNYRITVYAKRVGVASSKAALTGMNCDSYKQSAAFTVKPKVTLFDKEGQNYGSIDANKLETYKGDTKITANNIAFSNAKVEGDLYISGDNAVIKNVSATGKIVVDPGKDGSTTLEDVTAKNIEVLSGGQNSIHIKNVQAETMNVSSSTPVRVEADGDTEIVSTSASGYVIFDRKNGTYGTITISEGSDGAPVIEFRGDIQDKVQVETAATIKTGEDSKISNLVIATEKVTDTVKLEGQYNKVEVAKEAKVEIGETAVISDSLKVSAKADIKADAKSDVKKVDIATPTNETVNLEGKFTQVEINSEAKVEVAANTKIENIVANSNAEINLDKTAVVDKVDKGSSTVVVGGEGTVGTGTTPANTSPSTGGTTSGGGGGGYTPPDNTPQTMSITGIGVISATSITFNSSIAGAAIKWNGTALSSQTVSGVNTITVPTMTSGANNTLVIEKSGYTTFTRNNVVWTAPPNQEQVAPTGLAGVTPTSADNNDGKITGTTIAMEYKLESADDSTYATCSATETTVAAGTYSVRFAAKEGYNAGAAVIVIVPAYVAPAAKGTIGLSETLSGGPNSTYTIDGYHMTFGGEIKYYQAEEEGAFSAGNWASVKITAPEGITPGDDTVCTINDGEPTVGWGNIREEPELYNYFYLFIKVRDIARTYSIEMKWNNEVTETFLVDFAPSTTLEVFKTDLANMIDGAKFNYANATNYGEISDADVQAFNNAINAAQEVYDNAVNAKTEGVQAGIYIAQDELIAAQDAFFDAYKTTVEAVSNNMAANTEYTNTAPLIITLSLENGIGDFVTDNTDYITLGGDLSQMLIKSVTFEGDWATRAILELTGVSGSSMSNAAISIAEGGVNGHKHGFDTVAIPAKGTIGLSETLNGGENTTFAIDGYHMTFDGEIKYYQTGEDGAFSEGNWVGVKITAPEGIMPGDETVLTINDGEPVVGWDNICEEGDGDNYFYLYMRARDIIKTYSIEMKWNNEITETFLVDYATTTTLEVFKTDLENMIDGAKFNYDNAANYGEISDADVQAFNDAINAAQEVYDNAVEAQTDAVQADIYAAQDELIAAQDAFFDAYETTVEALAYNMEANTAYTDIAPLIITLNLKDGIGDFVTDNTDYITLGGDLYQMSIKSVTFEGEPATRAILELTGTIGETINNAAISIAEGGVNGHKHGFNAVVVPGAKGIIGLSETLSGGPNTTYTIDGYHMTFDGEIKYYQAGEDGAFNEGNWASVKITAPEGITPGDDTVCTINNGEPIVGWGNIREEPDLYNYFYLFIKVRDITRTYSIEMKWNNEITETFLVDFAPSTTLEVFKTDLGNMINGAQDNYNNAAEYGEISDADVQAFNDAINAAQEVYDNAVDAKTEDVQAGIYTAQDELIAAQDAFFDAYKTTVEAVSNNMAANTEYTDAAPLIITLNLTNGIGDFVIDNTDYITLGGDLSQMSIKSVTFEGEPATRAILELTGTTGNTIDNGAISIAEGGVNGHKHGFDALAVQQ